jgi:hypothetical protein
VNFAHGFHCTVIDDDVVAPGPIEPVIQPITAAFMTSQQSSQASPPTTPRNICEWLIDSAASQHICTTNEWFAKYAPVPGKSVMVANGQRIPVVGCGDIPVNIPLNDGRVESGIIRDVLYAPGVEFTLLSVPRMTEAGLAVSFHGKECLVRSKDGRVIGRATRSARPGTTTMYGLTMHPLSRTVW